MQIIESFRSLRGADDNIENYLDMNENERCGSNSTST